MYLEIVAIVTASVAAFTASSTDNLLLLVAFQATESLDRRSVNAGYVLALRKV